MPISFASMLGGSATLIGTSSNILVSSLSEDAGYGAIGMFEFTVFALQRRGRHHQRDITDLELRMGDILLVYGSGGYTYKDFVKFGLPLNILVRVIACLIIPWIWPF